MRSADTLYYRWGMLKICLLLFLCVGFRVVGFGFFLRIGFLGLLEAGVETFDHIFCDVEGRVEVGAGE